MRDKTFRKVRRNKMYCQYCGKEVPDGARFCGNCGKPVEDTVGPVVQRPTAQHTAEAQVEQHDKGPAAAPEEKKRGHGGKAVLALALLAVVAVAVAATVMFLKAGEGKVAQETLRSLETVSAGGTHTVGLRLDGTVAATGGNDFGQCDVENWTNIVAVSAGGNHTVGLRSDGTVVATTVPS